MFEMILVKFPSDRFLNLFSYKEGTMSEEKKEQSETLVCLIETGSISDGLLKIFGFGWSSSSMTHFSNLDLCCCCFWCQRTSLVNGREDDSEFNLSVGV